MTDPELSYLALKVLGVRLAGLLVAIQTAQ